MENIACKLMGLADIIAGILIIFAFNFTVFSMIFGTIMVIKGVFSFI